MRQQLKDELDSLAASAKRNHKNLLPAEVVGWAESNHDSALYAEFEWDDNEAANRFRIQQASQLVRAYIKVIPQVNRPVRAYISMPSDRVGGGGYRGTEEVIGNPLFRAEAVNEALEKIRRLRESFSYLPELDPLFDQLDAMAAQYRITLREMRPTG